MRIGLDARFLTHPQRGGFKTYIEGLVTALAQVDSDNDYVVYVDRRPAPADRIPDRDNFVTRVIPGRWPLVGMPFREQVLLSRWARRDGLALLHSPSLTAPLFTSCRTVVTIHDMIWHFRGRFSKEQRSSPYRKLLDFYYGVVPRWAARRAAAVVADSNSAKRDIIEHLGVNEARIFVTYLAASPVFRRIAEKAAIDEALRKYELPPTFVLGIGAADPRKNIGTLVRAYAMLPEALRRRYPLVIVWAHPALSASVRNQVEALGLTGQVRSVGPLSLEELALVYNAASVFVFPSRYEGFGMPVVEAMACGTPVVAADNSSTSEITGEAGLLVPTDDAAATAEGMARVLTDASLREALVSRGLKRASDFAWEKCARETILAYRYAASAGA